MVTPIRCPSRTIRWTSSGCPSILAPIRKKVARTPSSLRMSRRDRCPVGVRAIIEGDGDRIRGSRALMHQGQIAGEFLVAVRWPGCPPGYPDPSVMRRKPATRWSSMVDETALADMGHGLARHSVVSSWARFHPEPEGLGGIKAQDGPDGGILGTQPEDGDAANLTGPTRHQVVQEGDRIQKPDVDAPQPDPW
jgi:hypothetical protein